MGKKKLLEAVKAGDDAKVQKIVTKGKFNVDVCDEAGYSSLTHAAMLGYCKILRYLMQANVDMNKPDAQNRTALYVAALCDRVEVVRVLIEFDNLDVDRPCGKIKQTAVEAALELNNDGIVAVLGKYCGNWVVEAAKNADEQRIAELINRPGINLEAADFAGWTALHIAMKNNLSEIVKMLAKAGVSAELKTRSGQTALDVAHEMGHDDLVALYHSSKAVKKGSRFLTPEKQAERTARQSGHTTQADLLKRHKRKSLPAGIMSRIVATEEPETQHEIKPVVMTKEAWKHKDGASGKDSALLAQLNALKDQARADAVEIKPKRLDLPDGEDTSATDASTTDSANSVSDPSSPRVKVKTKGSWIHKGGGGGDRELLSQLQAMKAQYKSEGAGGGGGARPQTVDISEAQARFKKKQEEARSKAEFKRKLQEERMMERTPEQARRKKDAASQSPAACQSGLAAAAAAAVAGRQPSGGSPARASSSPSQNGSGRGSPARGAPRGGGGGRGGGRPKSLPIGQGSIVRQKIDSAERPPRPVFTTNARRKSLSPRARPSRPAPTLPPEHAEAAAKELKPPTPAEPPVQPSAPPKPSIPAKPATPAKPAVAPSPIAVPKPATPTKPPKPVLTPTKPSLPATPAAPPTGRTSPACPPKPAKPVAPPKPAAYSSPAPAPAPAPTADDDLGIPRKPPKPTRPAMAQRVEDQPVVGDPRIYSNRKMGAAKVLPPKPASPGAGPPPKPTASIPQKAPASPASERLRASQEAAQRKAAFRKKLRQQQVEEF